MTLSKSGQPAGPFPCLRLSADGPFEELHKKNNSTISFVFATRMPKDRLLLSKICTAEFLPNRAFPSHEAEFSEPRPSYGWLGFHPIARGMRRARS